MTHADRTKPFSNNGRVAKYLEVKQFRNDHTFTISCDGSCYYTVNGVQMPEQQFNEMFPLGLIQRGNKGNRIGNPQQLY